MIHPSEEKWLAMPVEKKLEFFSVHDRLVAAENRKLELLGELRKCLIHAWMKHTFGDLKDHDEKWFFGLVLRYYALVRANDPVFCYRDVANLPMEIMPIAIEWMTDYYKHRARVGRIGLGTNNPVTVRLYQMRRDHERKMNPREENE